MFVQSFKYFTIKIVNGITSVIQYSCIGHCIFEHIADIKRCSGSSMEPTILSNDIVISEHISSQFCRFNYGDIVVAISPNNPKEYICKRVTGLPGDKIRPGSEYNCLYVPSGHIWLEGDNRDNSLDSRNFGPVPQGLIKSRVICRIWPPKDIAMLTVKS